MKQTNLSVVLCLFMMVFVCSLCSCKDTTSKPISKQSLDETKPNELVVSEPQAKPNELVVNEPQAKPIVTKTIDSQPTDAIPIAVELKEAYQIRNKKHDLLLRPQNANKADGAPIVLYPEYPWKCLSWQFEKGPEGSYRLVNFFTSKTIQPAESHNGNSIPLVQATLDSQQLLTQYWYFFELPDGFYKIVSANIDMALTAIDKAGEAYIYLAPYEDRDEQKWKLEALPEKLTM